MRHEAKREAEKNTSDDPQFIDQDRALLVMHTSDEPKYATDALQVVVKAMRETSVSVSSQAAGLVEVVPHKHLARHCACMTAKEVMDVYWVVSFSSQSPTLVGLTCTFTNIRRLVMSQMCQSK